ncbi:CoA transferase [Amycolatopsis jejuensis]|uniref:CoA transferase n=1 Tax=Amycolatopsis jejuensis TaxID=330084 RepID=UPI000526642B|nr:CoA transferase [Amycolatopsis jejuensis]
MPEESAAPLTGIRVLDFGQYVAGPAVALMLADLGAEVIHVDPPEGPRWQSPAADALGCGKAVRRLDLTTPAGLRAAQDLIAEADVVIENFRPGVMTGFGLGPADITALNPHAVQLSLPGFGEGDPRRDTPGWEGVVMAATGGYTDMGLNRVLMGVDPSFTPLPLASAYAAALGALAVTVALKARERTGRGDVLEVPLAEAVLEGLAFNSLAVSDLPPRYLSLREHEIARRRRAGEPMDLTYDQLQSLLDPFYRSYVCRDGRLFYHCCPAHRTHAVRSLKLLGLWETVVAEGIPLVDPYTATDTWPDGVDCTLLAYPLSARWTARLTELISEVFRTRTAEEWERRFDAAGIPGAAHRSTLEWIRSGHPRAAGLVATIEGGLTVPGPVVWAENHPPQRTAARPAEGGFTMPRQVSPPVQGDGLPLSGVRILDLTNVIAGPMVGATLARFGADVIRVDPPTPGFDPYHAIVVGMHAQRGKRSVLADLKTPEGRDILDRLVASADAVTFNGTEDQLLRLGLDPLRLNALRPGIVLMRIDAYGGPNPGPRSGAVGYDDNVQACAGIMTRFGGGPDTPEEHAHLGTIDALAGFCAAFATVAALLRPSDQPRVMRTSLAAAGQLLQIPFLHDGPGRDDLPEPSGPGTLGASPGYQCYRAADGWFFLAGPDENVDYAFADHDVDHWVKLLSPRGFAVQRIEHIATLRERGLVRESAGPVPLRSSGVFVRHDRHPSGHEVDLVAPQAIRGEHLQVRMPSDAPQYGRHTREVLAELGYRPGDIAAMLRDGVVSDHWSETYLPA